MTKSSTIPVSLLKVLPVLALLAWVFYPTSAWMVDRWNAKDSYFAHGFLIPLVTLFWIWKQREELKNTEKRESWIGLPILIVGILLQAVAVVLRIYFVSAFSLVIILFGALYAIYGTRVIKKIWYPITFLFLMIPLPLLMISDITLKMKFFISEMATHLLNLSGFESYRQGSYIVLPTSYLLVGDPCSGLRSFLSFLCLGFVFAYGSKVPLWGKVILVGAGLPLAILSNLVRVYSLGLIAEFYGQEAAGGKVHDASGFIVFILAFLVFMAIRQALESRHG